MTLEDRRKKVNGKVAETGDVERGERLLRKIDDERNALLGDLQIHRLEVDKLQAEFLLSHAMSDRLMDKIDSRVREHWTKQNSIENQKEYNTQAQGLMELKNLTMKPEKGENLEAVGQRQSRSLHGFTSENILGFDH